MKLKLNVTVQFLFSSFGVIYLLFLLGSIYSGHTDPHFLSIFGGILLLLAILFKLSSSIAVSDQKLIIRAWFMKREEDLSNIKALRKTRVDYMLGKPEGILVELNSKIDPKHPIFIMPYLYGSRDVRKFIDTIALLNPRIEIDPALQKFADF